MKKICKKCGAEKTSDQFYKEPRVKSGLSARCIDCCKADAKAVYERDPEPTKARSRAAYDYAERRARSLMTNYNMTPQDYQDLFDKQNGCCAICGTDISGHNMTEHLLVDHCHNTNTVRGLLCCSCNLMLGKAQDNIQLLKNAITYLEKAPA